MFHLMFREKNDELNFMLYSRNQEAIAAAMRKPSVSIIDSVDLRYVICI